MKSKREKILKQICFIVIGNFIAAMAFNVFILPLNVVSGTSGIAVILNHLFGFRPSTVVMILHLVVLFISFLILGWKETKPSIVGSIVYPIFIELTSFLAGYIDIANIEPIVVGVCGALLMGLGLGLVYKTGYNTGGSDVLCHILTKKLHKPVGTCNLIINSFVIAFGLFVFGLYSCIYSIIVIYISSMIIDRVMIGISNSKTFQVITEHETNIKKFLLSQLSHGVTVMEARGGYTGNMIKVIMCIVPTREYITVKEGILEIDPEALIMVSDVYEVIGSK